MCSIYNSKLSTNPDPSNWAIKSGFWDDTGVWVDAYLADGSTVTSGTTDSTDQVWKDAYPLYVRNYYNDKKVSVMSNSESVQIEFKSNAQDPSTGFELSTVDMEALFFQRATRV
jgi:hypothetical protein